MAGSGNVTREGKRSEKVFNKHFKDDFVFSNVCDGVFAQLTDMFGDVTTSDKILNICHKYNWDLSVCIDNLIKLLEATNERDDNDKTITEISTPNIENHKLKIAYKNSETEDIDEEADVVIESEKIESEKEILADINNIANINLGAVKKQSTTSLVDENENSSALKSKPNQPKKPLDLSFSTLLKSNDNNMFSFPDQNKTESYQINKPFFKSNERRKTKLPNYDKALHLINQNFKIMIIMRGPVGCGKSHIARRIVDETVKEQYQNHVFSADDFFYNLKNQYSYDRDKVSEAHEYNQRRVRIKCQQGWSPIIVDNTNIHIWEMYPYVDMAAECGYFIEIMEPHTVWPASPRTLFQRNLHNVPLQKIQNMCQSYERISVSDLLRLRNLDFHLELSPQLRQFPEIKIDIKNEIMNDSIESFLDKKDENLVEMEEPATLILEREWSEDWVNNENFEDKEADKTLVPKPGREVPRLINFVNESEAIPNPTEETDTTMNNIDWKVHDQEMRDFWTKANTKEESLPKKGAKNKTNQSKPPRVRENKSIVHPNKFAVLKVDSDEINTNNQTDESTPSSHSTPEKLQKHKIGCTNENKSFSQIREIYPQIPIEYLWDLFETCRGDGDWTMDILLKDESKLKEFTNPQDETNFRCSCISNDFISFDEIPTPYIQSNTMIPTKFNTLSSSTSLPSTSQQYKPIKKEKPVVSEELQNAKRKIEETITLGNEHYSAHTRKIRDLRRRGQQSSDANSESSSSGRTESGAYAVLPDDTDAQFPDCDSESLESENEEIVEVKLGTELVSQLDSMFGIGHSDWNTKNNTKKIKTNVFMPKSFAQQLYALWMESVYNQIEEQKQQSIKEDEEFARSLHQQEKYPMLFKQPRNIKEIMDMEYTWAAYKAETDEWKTTTPQTLASKLSRDKLRHIFPSIDVEILEEILAAHDHKFDDTVNILKDSLKGNLNKQLEDESTELFEQARLELEKPSDSEDLSTVRSASESSTRSIEAKKLGAEEAKRLALKEFEECRNSAMHHNQLKVECYSKAQSAKQRGESQVALYYAQVAKLHKNKVDMYNQKAANCIMEVHHYTQNNPDIIDLHYLHVAEAVECLDIFLDKHINKLKSSPLNFKHLHVITGRGLHSAGGIPTIKHRVKLRLKERLLKSSEVNPGLIKVKVFNNSKLSQL